MSKHTPGPWTVFQDVLFRDGTLSVGRKLKRKEKDPLHEDADGNQYDCLCELNVGYSNGVFGSLEDEANARLIAAAPELLACCENALKAWTNPSAETDGFKLVANLSAAIKKARGEE